MNNFAEQNNTMLRKVISISLIFFVNIFLLAHTVLPHHHHNGIPHFAFHPTEEEHQAQHDCRCSHDEEEDDSCMFDQDVDVFFKSEEHHGFACCTEHANFSELLTAILLSFNYNVSAPWQDTPLIIPPYLISYHTDPVVSSAGLRAPPVL